MLLYLGICVMVIPTIDPIAVTVLCSVSLHTYTYVNSTYIGAISHLLLHLSLLSIMVMQITTEECPIQLIS